ncbi:MAG TPA: PAS domain S-box protein [Chthoniobacterales bacterium]|nr:PAS domain S-box protein [Chthoniobacterales bacterium]
MICGVAGNAEPDQKSRKPTTAERPRTAQKKVKASASAGRNLRAKSIRASRSLQSAPVAGRGSGTEEGLRKLNETLSVLFRFAPDAIIIVEENGCIVRVNDQAKAMFGYTEKEFLGKRIEMLMPARFRKRHVGHQEQYMAMPRLRRMGAGLELYAQRKDGSEFPVDIMLSPIETSEGRSVIATVRDVTERKQIEETLRRSREELEVRVRERTAELSQANLRAVTALEARARQHNAVAELGQRALEGRDVASLLDDAVSLVPRTLDVEFCKILELLPEGNGLLLRAGAGWKDGTVGQATLPTGKESHGGFTLLSSSPVIVEDFQTETRFRPPSLFVEHRIRSGISVIIHGRGRPYGVLGAHTARQRKFTTDDVHFLQSVANVLAAAIERRGLEDELLNISSREQRHIGQDLHDGLCQQLVGIEFRNSVLVQQLKNIPPAHAEAAQIGEAIREVTRQARSLARGLSPVQIETNGLMAALDSLTANAGKLFCLACSFECPRPVLVENPTIATHLYRIAQEAIGNAIKHGQAKSIVVSLKQSNGDVTLTIKDDGHGFAPQRAATEGMGRRIMEYRADMIGAILRVDSTIGKGTTVACRLKAGR